MKSTPESKRDRFVRIAEARTTKIMSMVRLLGNCSNKGVYEYSDKDVAKIFTAIEGAVSDAKKRFRNAENGNTDTFSLL